MIDKSAQAVFLFVCLMTVSTVSTTSEISVNVVDQSGDAVENAVVFVASEKPILATPGTEVIVDQIDKEFVPHVKVIQTGTAVVFPNMDNIRHQVYSFSTAKIFEIPLYKGTPAKPVMFDKPGVVSLGCNIHDWMSGFIFIASSPYFSITDRKGKAVIANLEKSDYTIQVWHPTLKGDPISTEKKVQAEPDSKEIQFAIKTKKVWSAWRGSGASGGGYR